MAAQDSTDFMLGELTGTVNEIREDVKALFHKVNALADQGCSKHSVMTARIDALEGAKERKFQWWQGVVLAFVGGAFVVVAELVAKLIGGSG
jgi:hypothetical protein